MKKKDKRHAKEAFLDIQDVILESTKHPSLKLIVHGNKFVRLVDGRMQMCANYTRIENPHGIENKCLKLFQRLSLASTLMANSDFLQLVLYTGANSDKKDLSLTVRLMPGTYTYEHPESMDMFLRKFV
jgi:hypothetical protein